MAKLFFRYGTMGSGKSLDLLKVAYNYEENGMNVIILTSKIDDRYGHDIVKSRTGVKKDAIGIDDKDNIFDIIQYKKDIIDKEINCILVDEVQFFKKHHIFDLMKVVDNLNIPVICYGLRTNFKLEPFESSSFLMSIADDIEELKTICSYCGKKKAIINAKIDKEGKVIIYDDKVIDIGGNEKYKPLCRICFNEIKNK